MAGSYSTGLRSRVLAAMEAGESPAAAAKRFAAGRSTAYRWARAARDEGRREAKRMGGGPGPRIKGAVTAALLDLIKGEDRKSTRLNSSHANISYAVFCLKKKNKKN